MKKKLVIFLILNCLVIIGFIYRCGDSFAVVLKQKLAVQFYNGILELYVPDFALLEKQSTPAIYRDVEAAVFPVFSYHEQLLWYDSQVEDWADYENTAAMEQQQMELLLAENSGASDSLPETEAPDNNQTVSGEETDSTQANENLIADNTQEAEEDGAMVQTEASEAQEAEESQSVSAPQTTKQVTINREKLQDFDYLCQNFYIVDSSTTIGSDQLNVDKLLGKSMKLENTDTEGPQILIYHTHSQEGYADSTEGDASTSVVAVGEYLTQILTEQYGLRVLHHTGEYDVGDRDHAYSNAAPALEEILEENPSIQVVIDLHRDSVNETTHLVTEVNGKQTAKIMFFNGLCRTTKQGNLTSLVNPYLEDNLAFSFQMQLAACEYYPDFTRHIYLKGYRYNMHYCPKSLLVEVGAQNNTLEEAMNAMEPLADILAKVLEQE